MPLLDRLIQTGVRASEESAAAARTAEKLFQETMRGESVGATAFQHPLLRRFSAEQPTQVHARRFIEGAADGKIDASTVSIDVLTGAQFMTREVTQAENKGMFGTRTMGGIENQRLKYLFPDEAREQAHITMSMGKRIIGDIGIRTSAHNADNLWVHYVSVEGQHQGKGYASRLIESLYDYAVAEKKRVEPSSFTTLGQKLIPVFDRLDKLHPQAATGIRTNF